jgi:hypothetical protein
VTLTFRHPFSLKGVDRRLGAGDYEVVTDEELIEEVSFPVYRRVATLIWERLGRIATVITLFEHSEGYLVS